jgi:hypothetical protein
LLGDSLAANDVPAIRALLKSLVHGYQPESPVVDWIHLAKHSIVVTPIQTDPAAGLLLTTH